MSNPARRRKARALDCGGLTPPSRREVIGVMAG